ncbi:MULTISPECIES: hypothetical protein [unclassified Streptomyces]|uniref:hypothetical protein n=1 Tax=unclassified Streptomyces TaxID=2593676 RepID=UPI0029BE2D9A|nr:MULTISPECIES: hypothetical protein [unclassified Streptomyces]MDX3766413.1 hypothetical protein [Streptomyces sp. AK08-01B]MDX3816330.1 hypothetical protein [Streptomyces sp. AK08-01A]
MTLIQPPMMVTGGIHPARTMRMMIRDLSRGSQGVTEYNDLKVTQLTTPGAGVQIADGSGVIRGAASGQGSYTQYNVGSATLNIAPTGATGRTDMVVLRVLDPDYEGQLNPAADDVGYFYVVSNVSSTATQPPAGMTAIPLARITLGPNTGTVTDAMITNLRTIANPRRDRQIYTASPSGDQNYSGNKDGTYVSWPTAARWNIAVPVWAVRTRIIFTVAATQVMNGSVWGHAAFKLGTVQSQGINFDTGTFTSGDRSQRVNLISADTITVPSAMRGTTQLLQAMIAMDNAAAGTLQVDTATTAIADVEFEEGVF